MSNIFIGLKKTCLGVLETGERDKNNETGLKVGGGIEMSTTVLPYTRCSLSSLKILTIFDIFSNDELISTKFVLLRYL